MTAQQNEARQFQDGLWYVTTTFATFGVTVKDGRVMPDASAPISRPFAFQSFERLVTWLQRKDPGFGAEHLLDPGARVVEKSA